MTAAQNCSASQEKETNDTRGNPIYTDWDWCQHQQTKKLHNLSLIFFIPCIVILIIYIDITNAHERNKITSYLYK